MPNAPLNLANSPTVTNAFQIGITWQEGLSNGGEPVAYYRLSYDQGAGGAFVTLEEELTSLSYTL